MLSHLIRFVIIIVTIIWATAFVVGVIDRSYSIPPTVQLSMGAVCGYLFAQDILLSKTKRKK